MVHRWGTKVTSPDFCALKVYSPQVVIVNKSGGYIMLTKFVLATSYLFHPLLCLTQVGVANVRVES